ncbi:hypothetical protein GCM10009555_093890 [Acrocarpospora macrocephala]|uniref:Uncharacterized protein n=1 Tax=Acrocarpospora macrocephala TaxID=150177 RepID=A0A5M3X608_9ACTN|nr:hypothetical protein Amac_107030 [Acrocarpospora macrocephala]
MEDRRTAGADIEGPSGGGVVGGVVTVEADWSAGVHRRKGGGTVVRQQDCTRGHHRGHLLSWIDRPTYHQDIAHTFDRQLCVVAYV